MTDMYFDIKINQTGSRRMIENVLRASGVSEHYMNELMNELETTGQLELKEIGEEGHVTITISED